MFVPITNQIDGMYLPDKMAAFYVQKRIDNTRKFIAFARTHYSFVPPDEEQQGSIHINTTMNTNNNINNMIKTDTNEDQPTILDIIQDHVNTTPEFEVYNWYDAKGRRTDYYTFATIWEKSGRVATALMDHPDIQQGDRVMICFPFGLDS